MTNIATREWPCPACGAVLKPGDMPNVGEMAICAACGGLAIVGDGWQLRALTADERAHLAPEANAVIASIDDVRKRLATQRLRAAVELRAYGRVLKVDPALVERIVPALGEISVFEACDVLDREALAERERAFAEGRGTAAAVEEIREWIAAMAAERAKLVN